MHLPGELPENHSNQECEDEPVDEKPGYMGKWNLANTRR
jgi:hypothetical protein